MKRCPDDVRRNAMNADASTELTHSPRSGSGNEGGNGKSAKNRQSNREPSTQVAAFAAPTHRTDSNSAASDESRQKNFRISEDPRSSSHHGTADTASATKKRRTHADSTIHHTAPVGLASVENSSTLFHQYQSHYDLPAACQTRSISSGYSKNHAQMNNSWEAPVILSKTGWIARATLAAKRKKALMSQPRSATYARLFMLQQEILEDLMIKAWAKEEGESQRR